MSKAVFLSPEPVIGDFPQDRDEMDSAIESVTRLADLQVSGHVRCVFTRSVLEALDPDKVDYSSPSYRYRAQLWPFLIQLAGHGASISMTYLGTQSSHRHPIPSTLVQRIGVEPWAMDVGTALQRHQRCEQGGKVCAGVAWLRDFLGLSIDQYVPPRVPAFALVDERSLTMLADAETWDVDGTAQGLTVGEADLRRNFRVIGGTRIESGTNHEKLWLESGKSWAFSKKWGDVWGERFINQLGVISDLPSAVVKYALKYGKLPSRKLRGCIG